VVGVGALDQLQAASPPAPPACFVEAGFRVPIAVWADLAPGSPEVAFLGHLVGLAYIDAYSSLHFTRNLSSNITCVASDTYIAKLTENNASDQPVLAIANFSHDIPARRSASKAGKNAR
jgi:hypothetical protein